MPIDLPWSPRTRQVQGRVTERRILSDRGAMVHPMSGAGRIKFDGSDDESLYEVKDAPTQYILKSAELESLWKEAVKQGKDPIFIIEFSTGIRAVIEVEK